MNMNLIPQVTILNLLSIPFSIGFITFTKNGVDVLTLSENDLGQLTLVGGSINTHPNLKKEV